MTQTQLTIEPGRVNLGKFKVFEGYFSTKIYPGNFMVF